MAKQRLYTKVYVGTLDSFPNGIIYFLLLQKNGHYYFWIAIFQKELSIPPSVIAIFLHIYTYSRHIFHHLHKVCLQLFGMFHTFCYDKLLRVLNHYHKLTLSIQF